MPPGRTPSLKRGDTVRQVKVGDVLFTASLVTPVPVDRIIVGTTVYHRNPMNEQATTTRTTTTSMTGGAAVAFE